jgi:LysM repeat protein
MNKLPAIAAAAALWLPSCGKKQDQQTDPVGDVKAPTATLTTKGVQGQHIDHRVKPGDTLVEIGERYGVRYEAIAEFNHIKDPSRIRIGDILRIPIPKMTPEGEISRGPKCPVERYDEKLSRQEVYERVTKGGPVPFLRLQHMPPEVTEHLAQTNRAIRSYALKADLPRTGPALCGKGVCTAFSAVEDQLLKGVGLTQFDNVFAQQNYYLLEHGSGSRDAFKIRETLEKLASMPESGWVRISINDIPRAKGLIVRKHTEGAMYHPGNLPEGTVLCYDPSPEHKGDGKGGMAWGHIEWVTKDGKGTPWYVHAIHSEVHGGSSFCRKQFHEMREGKGITCYAFVLTTPEAKTKWLATQLTAEDKSTRIASK